ncbi:MAG: hypothetical protein M1123_02290 [Candidatus Thermoplasmatota archaeon]|jgi:hypothetical protein|nr:hypothetical protein [Candidatus Thermoplasmatota archaeon]
MRIKVHAFILKSIVLAPYIAFLLNALVTWILVMADILQVREDATHIR